MPSWLKKRFQVLKRDLISHIGKNHQNFTINECEKLCDSNNERITNNIKSPIQKIRNDLKAQQQQRFRTNKSDTNAYHDYAKWRDQVLISQNNCALRCIKEEKINNTDNNVDVDSQCTAVVSTVATTASTTSAITDAVSAVATNETDCTSTLDSRHNHTNDKSASGDGGASDDANCDSESEFCKESCERRFDDEKIILTV